MAHRSQCSSAGDNPLDPNYLPAHYREEYRMAIDTLVEENREGYYHFLKRADVVDFLSSQEIEYIQRCVQVPHEGNYGDQQRCQQETSGDSSSDTYWPVHSDLDAPDLDLGWPQPNHFVGPTEVTTLVNPAEHDMPSIKDQARRLIKNAQQVVAIVMDMFTDVDIFAEILDAAMRNVAVYILLDEQNAHHFVNMLSNCRVNLESIQYLRVRTVSGISYQCRSGKTLKGQMMDRFLLTDCRAVLSGNYSFMWSFEKLHRCLAHLFLGQLVSTFDEEFRILFAQSQPLTIGNLPAPMEDFVPLPEKQYLIDRTASFRDSEKYATADNPCPDEWPRPSFDERMDPDWKKMPHNRYESTHRSVDPQSALDMYKYPTQQMRVGQTYDQNTSRTPFNMMETPNFKRHSYAEGISGRQTSYQPMWQPGMTNLDSQGRPFNRSHHAPPRAGMDAGYSAYDKFRSHAYLPLDQYPEPGLPHEMDPPENFDMVQNYLLSTRNVDMDQMSDNFNPPAELSSGSSRPRRLSVGQPQAYESTPSPTNPPEKPQTLQASKTDRKDPAVRQGLRNWRINSYLSAFDNAEDEEMPLPPHQASDPFDDTPNPSDNTVSGPDLSTSKFPNTREFKVPATPRAMPSYRKSTVLDSSEKYPEDFLTLPAQAKLTPSTSESSLTEIDKADEMEQQEPKDVRPEESFRRRYNPTTQRSSRLRSSLIFSSQLEQPVSQDVRNTTGEQDEDTDKSEVTQSKLPFALQVLGQRRTIGKEPFEWSRYVKSASSSLTEPSKTDDVENKDSLEKTTATKPLKDNQKNTDIVAASKPLDIALMRPSTSQYELSQIDKPIPLSESLLGYPFVDMSDADNRLMFFQQLAAKRKAEKMAESEKRNTDKVVLNTEMDAKNTTVKVQQPAQEKQPNPVVVSCENEQSNVKTDSEKLELKKNQTQMSKNTTDQSSSQPLKDPSLSDPVVKDSRQIYPAALDSVSVTSLPESTTQSANKLEDEPEPSSKEASSPASSNTEQLASSKSAPLETNTSPPNSSESSAPLPVVVEPNMSPLVPSSSLEEIQSNVHTSKNITTYLTRPLIVREPFNWNRSVRSSLFDSTVKKPSKADNVEDKEEGENSSGVKDVENSDIKTTSNATEVEQAIPPLVLQPSTTSGELSKTDQPLAQPQSLLSNLTADMSDADNRLMFFKELAAQRKAEKAAAAAKDAATISLETPSDSKVTTVQNEELAVQKPNTDDATGFKKGETTLCKTALEKNVTKYVAQLTPTESPTVGYDDVPSKTTEEIKQSQNDPVPLASCENKQSSVMMDSEKIELKNDQEQTSTTRSIPEASQSTISSQSLNDHNLLEPSVKDGSQIPPSNVEHSELPHETSPTESTKHELESLKHDSSLKASSSSDSSSTEQQASPKSAPSEINTSTPTTTESSAVPGFEPSLNQVQSIPSVPKQNASDSSASQTTTTDPTPSLSETLSTMAPCTTLESNSIASKAIDTEPLNLPSLDSSKTSIQTPEEATPSSPTQTVLSSEVETMKPESITVPTEIPMTVETGNSESNTFKASEIQSKPNSLQTPTEKLPEESCSLPPSSNMELTNTESNTFSESSESHSKPTTPSLQTPSETLPEEPRTLSPSSSSVLPETESNSVESSSTTEVLPSQDDVQDQTNASPCSADRTENSESMTCNIKKELVDSSKLNAADNPSAETQIQKTSASDPDTPSSSPSSTLAPDSDGSVVLSKPKTMDIPTASEVASPPQLSSPDLEKSPIPLLVDSLSDSQTVPTLEVSLDQTPDQTKPTVPCDVTMESKSIASKNCPIEPKVTAEKSSISIPCEVSNEQGPPDTTVETSEAKSTDAITKTILQDSACPEKPSDQTKISTCPEKVSTDTFHEDVPLTPQSKQHKATPSRYHSSTANVISSSNLRDDTKLLLGQISVNSQNRNEPIKELSVTDDDKESEAEKNVIGQKDGGSKIKSRTSGTKTAEEREVLLKKIQSMRKERKVYSRFEMPP